MGKEDEKRIQAMEMWLYRRMLKISWTEKKTNEEVLEMANSDREILGNIKSRQLRFVGHILRSSGIEEKIIEGKIERKKRRGRPRRNYMDDIKKNVGEDNIRRLKNIAEDRSLWHNHVAYVLRDTAHR